MHSPSHPLNPLLRLLKVVILLATLCNLNLDRLVLAAVPEEGPDQPNSLSLSIRSPLTRMVVQRDNSNRAIIPIKGSCPSRALRLEARATPRRSGQGRPTGWISLSRPENEASFHSSLACEGGWYDLEVRALLDAKGWTTSVVERVGVGEVFIVVGHSVAAGQDENIGGTEEDRVNTVPLDKNDPAFQAYLQTGDPRHLPSPGFAHYGSGVMPAPFGNGNYFWSKFGEWVVRKQNVPVLLYNAAFGGTSLEHWAKSAQSNSFEHSFVKASIRMPYINLYNTLKKYIPLTGLRAILADQGQNDWPEQDEERVFQNYLAWVNQARADLNDPELAIVANRQTPFLRDAQIRRVQERVCQLPHCFPGPDYDTLAKEDRPDAIHLGLSGQARAARLWAEALDEHFFRSSKPWLPNPPSAPGTPPSAGEEASYPWYLHQFPDPIIFTAVGPPGDPAETGVSPRGQLMQGKLAYSEEDGTIPGTPLCYELAGLWLARSGKIYHHRQRPARQTVLIRGSVAHWGTASCRSRGISPRSGGRLGSVH